MSFINYNAAASVLSTATYRNSGVTCADTDDFIDSVMSGLSANCSNFDIQEAIDALEDGEFLTSFGDDKQPLIESLHHQFKRLQH